MDKKKAELYGVSGLPANSFDKKWFANVKKVFRFYKLFGHLPAYKDGNSEECKLADWCQKQRIYAKQNIHTSPRKKAILSSSGIFDSERYKYRWRDGFIKLESFYIEHNRLPEIHAGGAEGLLYNWLVENHRHYRTGAMPESRVMLFKKYADMFVPRREKWAEQWKKKYLRLSAFCEEFKRLPRYQRKDIREKRCYTWMICQNTLIRSGKIDKKRKTLFLRVVNEYGGK